MKGTRADYSDEQAHRIAYLVAGYIRKTLTVAEHDELDAWVETSDENMRLFEELTDEKNRAANLAWMEQVQTEKKLQQISASLSFKEKKAKKRVLLWPALIAASILLAVAIYFIRTSSPTTTDVAQLPAPKGDVPPGGTRATLTLGDGTVIDLAQAASGLLKQEGGAAIVKSKDGEVAYRQEDPNQHTAAYHQLTTPIGGQYTLTLSDGTRVWLNAASSLRYLSQFPDGERKVELVGEAYFEVAKNPAKPFVVQLPNQNAIQVLGTHFNVSTYGDEATQLITLVEGSVRVTSNGKQVVLKPSQQARLSGGAIDVASNIDIATATGWKEGSFVFHNADIQTIMRQVRRWYNVDVVYKVQTSQHFNATISRQEPVSQLLHLLELTGKIHFKVENKTIYVLP